jgi:hypothetical protein
MTSIRALRRERAGGATTAVRFVADHEGVHRQVCTDFRFESGRLVDVELDCSQPADVIVRCNYAALHDYITGTISIAEGVELDRFVFEGDQELIRLAIEELDSDISAEAIEATDRGFFAARLAVMQTGAVAEAIIDPDFVLRPKWSEAEEWQADLIVSEWERRTSDARR